MSILDSLGERLKKRIGAFVGKQNDAEGERKDIRG
jgi:hypothetical protein